MTAKEISELIKNRPFKDGEQMIKDYTEKRCKEQIKICIEQCRLVMTEHDKKVFKTTPLTKLP